MAELLSQLNEPLQDIPWIEGNLPTGHKTTIRTGLPQATWRRLNYGVPPAKSTTAQITDVCGMLETYSVIDKDLGAALLGRQLGVDVLVIATDVPHVVTGWGTPDAAPVGRVTVSQMREIAERERFASGSMGPKVDAACRFVEQGGSRAVITDLEHITAAIAGDGGTVVVPN